MKIHPAVIRVSVVILLLAAVTSAVAAVPAPALLSPASGASLPTPLTISWSAVSDPSGIIGYNWQVSTSSNFTNVILQNSTNGQTQDTVSGLPNGTYFWRVQAVNGAFVQGAWSAGRSFNVTGAGAGQPGAPTMSPTKGYSTFHPLEVMTFNWSPVTGAATYVLQFSADPSFPVSATSQFNNIPNNTFSFSTPNEGSYYARVVAVNANGIAGVPSNAITYSVFYNNPLPAPPSLLTPTNGTDLTLPITITWTDVPNPQPSGYELQIAKDSGFKTIEEEAPQLNQASRTELSLTPGQKFWRIRSAQGDASPTTAAVTNWSASGTFTVSQAPPAPVSMVAVSNPIFSGNTTFVQLQFSTAAPTNGAVINLTSSDPNAFPVPATVTMPGNTGWMQFQTQAGQVTTPTPVTVTATLNSGTATLKMTVLPPSIKSIQVNPGTISGGATAAAFITLNGLAPAGGAQVDLTSDSPAALAPAVATVQAGNSTVVAQIPTNSVSANTLAHITASWNGASATSQLTITPQGQPASITLNPATVSGTTGSFAVVTVATPSTTDQIFQITNSNPNVVNIANSVLIPAGATAGGVTITNSLVTTLTQVTISVSGGGVTRSATLTINPTVAPTTFSLGVVAGGRSGERVISSPAGISVPTSSNAVAQFAPGTVITLSVTDGRDAIWGGDCSSNNNKTQTCTFTIKANSTVTANVQ
ncbi:MAG TPA: fibronectin type III domain-containing protein [Candidatus Angelobacter sp.]|nr:fibronectin type III domain-containing protein [Candidatus Angelobacter sp.]